MLASFPCAALFWLAYEYSKYFIHNTEVLNNNLDINTQHFIAASIGGLAEALSRCPFEVVKLNMQLGKYGSQSEAISDIWRTKGLFSGFYAGFIPLILREVPFS